MGVRGSCGPRARRGREGTIDNSRGRPIFILGCPRSGTTLLGLMLQAHPSIAIPPENRFLLPVYFGREEFGDLQQPENRRLVAEKILASKQFKDMHLDKEEITDAIVADAPTVGAAVGLVLRAYADRFGKLRWGDKRPNYRNYIWAIQRMFPTAQFIHIVRDGRDCVASMASLVDWKDSTYPRLRAWMESIDHAQAARKRLPADTFYELQYEHLVTDPQKQLTALSEFLGESFDEAMLNPSSVADQVVPDRKTWHERTRQQVSPASVGKFTERLEPWQIELCEAVMGERLREYGYELTGAPPPAEEHLEAYREADAAQEQKLRKQKERDEARVDPQPVTDMTEAELRKLRRAESDGGSRSRLRRSLRSILGGASRKR